MSSEKNKRIKQAKRGKIRLMKITKLNNPSVSLSFARDLYTRGGLDYYYATTCKLLEQEEKNNTPFMYVLYLTVQASLLPTANHRIPKHKPPNLFYIPPLQRLPPPQPTPPPLPPQSQTRHPNTHRTQRHRPGSPHGS